MVPCIPRIVVGSFLWRFAHPLTESGNKINRENGKRGTGSYNRYYPNKCIPEGHPCGDAKENVRNQCGNDRYAREFVKHRFRTLEK